MEAHKVILASSSPFFEKILQQSKHPHPLIYLRGFQSKDFASILDFLYFGEANVYQDDLDSFLAIAEEIKLKGLTGQTSSDLVEEQEKPRQHEPVPTSKKLVTTSPNYKSDGTHDSNTLIKPSKELAIPINSGTDLQALDEQVKSMMEKGQKMITVGKQGNGMPKRVTSSICKMCGKEGPPSDIRHHIESNHLEGISIPCDSCAKNFSTRNSLEQHKNKFHK